MVQLLQICAVQSPGIASDQKSLLFQVFVPYWWQAFGSLSALGGRFYAWAQFLGFPAKTPAPAGRQNIYFVPSNFDGSDEAPCIVPLDSWVQYIWGGGRGRWQSVCPITHNSHHPALPKLLQTLRSCPACPELQCQMQKPTKLPENISHSGFGYSTYIFHMDHQYSKADMCHHHHNWQESTFSKSTESAKGLRAKFTQRISV